MRLQNELNGKESEAIGQARGSRDEFEGPTYRVLEVTPQAEPRTGGASL